MAEATTVVEVPIKLCRVGTFYDDKEKPFHRFRYVSDDGDLGSELAFEMTKHTKFVGGVGTVWEVSEIPQSDGSKRWRLAGAKYQSTWDDQEQRVQWDAEQEVRDAHHAASMKAKRAKDDRPLMEAIAPLRALYKSQIGSNRTQLLAFIVSEITK